MLQTRGLNPEFKTRYRSKASHAAVHAAFSSARHGDRVAGLHPNAQPELLHFISSLTSLNVMACLVNDL
jgi:hypothetical protein